MLLVPEQRGKYPNVNVGAYKAAARLLVPEQRGKYPKNMVGIGIGIGVGVGVGAIKAGSTPCCWYRHHKSGVGALLGGAFLKEKPKLLKF